MPIGFTEISSLLQENNTLFITVSVIFGLMVGSFLNVVIYRLPKMMEQEWHNNCLELQGKEIPVQTRYSIVKPRSACPHCAHQITALENIPIISYLALKGRCRACKAPISMRYPLIEALTGVLIGLISWKFGYSTISLLAWIFTFALITLTFIDFDTQLLPDDITLPLLWLGLLFNLNFGFTDLKSAVIGAAAGYLVLWSVYWLFKLIRGKEGMGYGDFKLLAAIGAWFGWKLLPAVILLSSTLGAAIGIAGVKRQSYGTRCSAASQPGASGDPCYTTATTRTNIVYPISKAGWHTRELRPTHRLNVGVRDSIGGNVRARDSTGGNVSTRDATDGNVSTRVTVTRSGKLCGMHPVQLVGIVGNIGTEGKGNTHKLLPGRHHLTCYYHFQI